MKVQRPAFANVIALIALFVALGGGAYALSIGKGEVKSKHIAKNAVKSKHIKNGKGVKSVDVANGSLTGQDIAADTLGGAQIDESGLALPKAYARVAPDGTMSQAKGIAQPQVTHPPSSGTYCFDIDATHAQVSGGWLGGGTGPVQTIFVLDDALADQAMPGGPPGITQFSCAPDQDFMVGTGVGGGSPEDSSFWIMFF